MTENKKIARRVCGEPTKNGFKVCVQSYIEPAF